MKSNILKGLQKPFKIIPEYLADFNKNVKEMSYLTEDQIKKLLSNAKAVAKCED